MNVLVVGGAGYIGSHCVCQLLAAGHRPVVIDNLVFGHRSAVKSDVPFYDCDIGNSKAIGQILREESIELVMHFAAFAYVGESVNDPRKYYENNFVATLRLLEAMLDNGVKKFVFSSTCATYGEPDALPMLETLAQEPINPYGQTKLDVENCLKAFARAYGLSFAAFRYFNAAGASEDGSMEKTTIQRHILFHSLLMLLQVGVSILKSSVQTTIRLMELACETTYMLMIFLVLTLQFLISSRSLAVLTFTILEQASPVQCVRL